MCRNIWTTNLEYEIFDAFGRNTLNSGSLLDDELVLAQESRKNHHRFFSVKLSEILSDEVIRTYDEAVRKFCEENSKYTYIEGSTIGDYYLNILLFLAKHPNDDLHNKRSLKYSVSVEFRAEEDDPESVYGDSYAVFDHMFGSKHYYEPVERSRMISEVMEDMRRTLSAEYVEHWLLNAIEYIPIYPLALQAMMEET